MNSDKETGMAIWVIIIAFIIAVALVLGDWALNQQEYDIRGTEEDTIPFCLPPFDGRRAQRHLHQRGRKDRILRPCEIQEWATYKESHSPLADRREGV